MLQFWTLLLTEVLPLECIFSRFTSNYPHYFKILEEFPVYRRHTLQAVNVQFPAQPHSLFLESAKEIVKFFKNFCTYRDVFQYPQVNLSYLARRLPCAVLQTGLKIGIWKAVISRQFQNCGLLYQGNNMLKNSNIRSLFQGHQGNWQGHRRKLPSVPLVIFRSGRGCTYYYLRQLLDQESSPSISLGFTNFVTMIPQTHSQCNP